MKFVNSIFSDMPSIVVDVFFKEEEANDGDVKLEVPEGASFSAVKKLMKNMFGENIEFSNQKMVRLRKTGENVQHDILDSYVVKDGQTFAIDVARGEKFFTQSLFIKNNDYMFLVPALEINELATSSTSNAKATETDVNASVDNSVFTQGGTIARTSLQLNDTTALPATPHIPQASDLYMIFIFLN